MGYGNLAGNNALHNSHTQLEQPQLEAVSTFLRICSIKGL
jgi:hypothetical protein